MSTVPRCKTEFDLDQIEGMAARFCKSDEIARQLGFDKQAFDKRKDVWEAFEKGRNCARIGLRTLLFDTAANGDRQAIIFLAKNELGYRDYPPDAESRENMPVIIDDVAGAGKNG